MIVLDKYSYRAYIIYSKSVKLLRLELYGNDIYTSIQAIIRRYRTIVSLLMIVLDKYSYRAYIIYSKSVKLLRLELYGNDIYTSIRAII